MRLRRRMLSEQAGSSEPPAEPRTQTCPHCGYEASGIEGRLVDPTTGGAVCVRCGAEVGGSPR
ncbi:MAG TPA: hypothetical protein VGB64_11775 [Actinomycetota bacterium]